MLIIFKHTLYILRQWTKVDQSLWIMREKGVSVVFQGTKRRVGSDPGKPSSFCKRGCGLRCGFRSWGRRKVPPRTCTAAPVHTFKEELGKNHASACGPHANSGAIQPQTRSVEMKTSEFTMMEGRCKRLATSSRRSSWDLKFRTQLLS